MSYALAISIGNMLRMSSDSHFPLRQPSRPQIERCSRQVSPGDSTRAAWAGFLAVRSRSLGGDGWESNPPRTPQQRPANGFEDRGSDLHAGPPTSAQDANE